MAFISYVDISVCHITSV